MVFLSPGIARFLLLQMDKKSPTVRFATERKIASIPLWRHQSYTKIICLITLPQNIDTTKHCTQSKDAVLHSVKA